MNKTGVLLLVVLSVFMGVASAVIMNEAAHWQGVPYLLSLSAVGVAMVLNVARFGLWGFIYRRWQVSSTYPLTSMFFPAVFIVDIVLYNVDPSAEKIIGTILITIGIVVMVISTPTNQDSPSSERIIDDV